MPTTTKRRKLSFKKILILFLVLYIIGCIIYYFVKLPIKNIYISGTINITDNEIIKAANIQNYPSIFKYSSNKLEKNIQSLALVKTAKVKKNIFGKLTIEIVENKTLFYNRNNSKIVLEDGNEVDSIENIYGYPILVNHVKDTVYEDLIAGLAKIDASTINLVSEIIYSPIIKDNIIIDDSRFLLLMNDGNHVYINTVNILKFNSYPDIYSTLEDKGILNMDSSTKEVFSFCVFGSCNQTGTPDGNGETYE